MIWLVVKVLLFIAALIALSTLGASLVDADGRVAIVWNGMEYPPLTIVEFAALVLVAMAALFVLYKLAGLALAVLRFLLGDQTAISRFLARSKERRGLEALSTGMVALAEGDHALADAAARKAARLLGDRDLTALLSAQVAEARGDMALAKQHYRALAKEPPTAIVGVKGLLAQAVKNGETERAMKLAGHAAAIRPKDAQIQQTLFDLQVKAANWEGARETLRAMARAKALPRDVATRREGVLDLEIARAHLAKGEISAAAGAADAAVKAAPGLAPAAAFAARQHVAAGEAKRATAILKEAWRLAPQPELAQAFAEIAPSESPAERRRRFRDLLATNDGHPESRLTEAELAIADSDWTGAARALGDLAAKKPTHRALAIMAAAEKGQGAPDAVVRGYLARAITAPRGAHWTCDRCGAAPGAWTAACPSCGGFDTLSWRETDEAPEALAASMLPLIVETGAAKDEADRLDDEAAAEAVREAQPAR